MLDIFKVFILSIVEAFTEFIPVSSTGHMIIIENLINLSNNKSFVVAFQVIIQLGAILSVIIYFKKEIFPINLKFWYKIAVAVIPAVILGLLFDDIIEKYLFSSIIVAITLIFYGIILIFIEKYIKPKKEELSYRKSFLIGLFQCLAMIPGTSRSAASIIGAMFLGLNKIDATKFSFFLAIPTMLGATTLKLIKVKGLTNYEYFLIALGFIFSFIFSYFSISLFLGYIKKHNFKIFGYYRVILGLIVLAVFIIKNLI